MSEKTIRPWSDIKNQFVRLYGNEFTIVVKGKKKKIIRFSTSIGAKDDDGEWQNCYIRVNFAKACGQPEETGSICVLIKKGFVSAETYVNADGDQVTYPVIVIMDWGETDDPYEEKPKKTAKKTGKKAAKKTDDDEIDDDDIPFDEDDGEEDE